MGDSLSVCVLTFFVNTVEDNETRSILQETLDLSKQHIQALVIFFNQAQLPIPEGFTDKDVDINAPRLFTDEFYLLYVCAMSRAEMLSYSQILSNCARKDIRDYFTKLINQSTDLYNKTADIRLSKGIFTRFPQVEVLKSIEHLKQKGSFRKYCGYYQPIHVIIFIGQPVGGMAMDTLDIFNEFAKLSPFHKEQLYNMIYPVVKNSSDSIRDYLTDIREVRFSKGTYCPHCKSIHVIGHGKYRSRQRYLCKDCGKTFNDISCSPIAGTHYPEKWGKYIQCIADGMTLPKIVKLLDISLSTAFYWRHKVLNSLRSMDIDSLSGIIESDETFFLESFKGKYQCKTRKPNTGGGTSNFRGISHEQVCVLVAMDRTGHILSRNAGMGRITAKQIDNIMGDHIAPNSLLCSDSAKNYIAFAKLKGLEHKQINASKKKRVIEKIYHIQHVNSYHGRLKAWLNLHFNGVSTKYMDNYLFWSRFLELNKALDKVELKRTLLTQVLAANKATTVNSLRLKTVV